MKVFPEQKLKREPSIKIAQRLLAELHANNPTAIDCFHNSDAAKRFGNNLALAYQTLVKKIKDHSEAHTPETSAYAIAEKLLADMVANSPDATKFFIASESAQTVASNLATAYLTLVECLQDGKAEEYE